MAAVKHPAGENQHTKRRANKQAAAQREAWKERIEPGKIMSRLLACHEGKVTLTPSEIKAGEVVLDRLMPRLSAVEETHADPLDSLSRDDILQRIQALLAADPTLLGELVAADARNRKDSDPTPEVVHVLRASDCC
jgi:hypothetical protein